MIPDVEYTYLIDDGNFYVDGGTYTIRVQKDITYPDEAENFVDGNIGGVLQKVGDKARWGLEFFLGGATDDVGHAPSCEENKEHDRDDGHPVRGAALLGAASFVLATAAARTRLVSVRCHPDPPPRVLGLIIRSLPVAFRSRRPSRS